MFAFTRDLLQALVGTLKFAIDSIEVLRQIVALLLQLVSMLLQLAILMLQLTVVVIQAGDLVTQVGFELFAFTRHLLQALVGPLKFAIDTVETL